MQNAQPSTKRWSTTPQESRNLFSERVWVNDENQVVRKSINANDRLKIYRGFHLAH